MPATVWWRVIGFWTVFDDSGIGGGVLDPGWLGRESLPGVEGLAGDGSCHGFLGASFVFCCAANFSCICCCCIFFRSFWDIFGVKLPLLSRRPTISKVRFDTRD